MIFVKAVVKNVNNVMGLWLQTVFNAIKKAYLNTKTILNAYNNVPLINFKQP